MPVPPSETVPHFPNFQNVIFELLAFLHPNAIFLTAQLLVHCSAYLVKINFYISSHLLEHYLCDFLVVHNFPLHILFICDSQSFALDGTLKDSSQWFTRRRSPVGIGGTEVRDGVHSHWESTG